MSKGYSKNFIDTIEGADKGLLGVQLGSMCVKNDIPVTDVAEFLEVSRMTVYNWFKVVFSRKMRESTNARPKYE